jgi:sRNA-binding protein
MAESFPGQRPRVRPLQTGIRWTIAAEMGWSTAYTGGVLRIWTVRPQYCRACLNYPTRIALDGSPTDELVDDEARAMARERIEQPARKAEEWKARESPPPTPEPPADVPPPAEERKRDGFAALRQAHRNRIAAAGP